MNVLILSASTGGGHNRTSEALKKYILAQSSDSKVEIIDCIEHCNRLYNKAITDGYRQLALKAPKIYGQLYRRSDQKTMLNSLVDTLVNQISTKLISVIDEVKPDIIVCCHPFNSKIMSRLKETGKVCIPYICVVTDFKPHRSYFGRSADAYVTPCEDMSDELIYKYEIEANRIYPFGIPIDTVFYENQKGEQTLSELGFTKDKPIVLIMAGSFGVTDILNIYEDLISCDTEMQIIVITGKNQKLYDAFDKIVNASDNEFDVDDTSQSSKLAKLERFVTNFHELSEQRAIQFFEDLNIEIPQKIRKYTRKTTKLKPTKLFYFINNVEDYMHISDLIITKPGGLTTSESLACNLPMAIFKAIPGQEEENANYLIMHELAILLDEKGSEAKSIEALIKDKNKLDRMKENCKLYSKDNAVGNTYELMLKLIKEHSENK